MEIATKKIESFVMIMVSDILNLEDCNRFLEYVTRLIDQGSTRIIVDLTNVSSLSSQAIGILVTVWVKIIELDGSMYILSNQDYINSIFEVTSLDKAMKICKSEEELKTEIGKLKTEGQ